jgi:hypothetical protein
MDLMADASVCRNPACDVGLSGVCALDNDPIESCPEYGADEPALDEDAESEAAPTSEQQKFVDIRQSEVLDEPALWQLRQRSRTITVGLIGDVKAGKTTLIATLYAQFCKGPYGGHRFKASRTLTGFARRHHLALTTSGRQMPATPRTSMGDGVSYFHLSVVNEHDAISDLIISDRSGEAFRAARINTDLIGNLTELKLCDRICFLLDADKLTTLETRASYRREFKQLIWALLQNNAFAPGAILEVLTTKIDKLAKREDRAGGLQELQTFESSLIEELKRGGFEASIYRICALPRANYETGIVGIEDLLTRWLDIAPSVDVRPVIPDNPARAMDRLLEFWDGGHPHG